MRTPGRVPVAWRARAEPLAPCAVAGTRDVAHRLLERLRARDDAVLGRLEAVVGDDLIVVLGEAEDLPWADGAVYLGRDASAPEILWPTTLGPDMPVALVASAVRSSFPDTAPPLVLLPPELGGIVASTAAARPLSRAVLAPPARA